MVCIPLEVHERLVGGMRRKFIFIKKKMERQRDHCQYQILFGVFDINNNINYDNRALYLIFFNRFFLSIFEYFRLNFYLSF